MALRIRLTKTGRRNAPYYRVVVAERREKRDGRIVEQVGHYSPRSKEAKAQLKKERIAYWMSKGAIPTATV